MTTFQCPDCQAVHTEPADASFTLAVTCLDCHLGQQIAEAAFSDSMTLSVAA